MAQFTPELIIRYLDNTLHEGEEQILLDWLKESDQNREIFLTCKKIYALGKVRHYSDPIALGNALQLFKQKVSSIETQKRKTRILLLTKYAAAVIFLLAITGILWYAMKEKQVEYLTVHVNNSEPVKMITLPDSSKVWLNNGSSLTYPVSFHGKSRDVSLTGEAYFEVITDSIHQFIVKAQNMQVKVYGTSFNVNASASDSTVKTTLVSGQIAIGDASGNNLAMVSPGYTASFNKLNKTIQLFHVNTDLYTIWRKGMIAFEKASISEITNKIEEFYNVQITINQRSKIENKINFVFRKSQPLDTVLEMLKFVAPVQYKKYDDQIYINMK